MNARYFKGTGSLTGSEWRTTPEGMEHRLDKYDQKWRQSIFSEPEELLLDPEVTETDEHGNPLQP